jgi:5-methylcytosine-specific restriction protein B
MAFEGDAAWGRCRIAWPSVQPMYAAAARWRDSALVGDDSLFDGRQLNTRLATDELVEQYVSSPDFGSGSFVSKLKGQLAEASDDAIQVAAELLYVHTLVASTTAWSARKKAELVNTVTAIGGPGVAPLPDDLAAVLAGGAAGTGQAYLNYRPRMFTYLVMVFRTIKALPPADRREAVSSLPAWRLAVAEVDTQSVWSQQYALEHLLFPDVAPPILSRTDRASIVAAFPEAGADIETVCATLEPNVTYGNRSFVDPYWFPLRQRWNPSPAEALYAHWALQVTAAFDLDERERNYKTERQPLFAAALDTARQGRDPHAELKAALTGFNVVSWQVADAFLTWVQADPQTAAAALTELQTEPGPESIDRFLALVPWESLPGMGARLSIASTLFLGCAPDTLPPWRDTASRTTQRLTGGYACEAAAGAGEIYLTFLERLDMILHTVNDADPDHPVLRDRLDAQGLAFTVADPNLDPPGWEPDQKEAFTRWQQNRTTTPPPITPEPPPQPVNDDLPPGGELPFETLTEQLYLDDLGVAWLEETLALLSRKGQLILQGPPGTGKTYVARAVAQFLAGSDERVTTVQFHPGTSYEDFVQGLRPDPATPARFTVVDGPLITTARAAAAHPDQTYVLVIDEINRGNIPAIFGELYLLLEYRTMPVTLLYGAEQSLPPNLMIIGTMNTADRSITALDAALRRRFYIRDLRPDQPPVDGILRRYLAAHAPHLAWLADLLDTANRAIGDPDQHIGPSHFMGDVDETWARRAWSYSVMPTLRELYYNDSARADTFEFDVLRDTIPSPDPASHDSASDPAD